MDIMFTVPSSKVTMTKFFPDELLSQTSEVTLTCETDISNPISTITWNKDGSKIDGSKLYVVTTSERAGEYNGYIRISSLSFTVTKQHGGSHFGCSILSNDSIRSQNDLLTVNST